MKHDLDKLKIGRKNTHCIVHPVVLWIGMHVHHGQQKHGNTPTETFSWFGIPVCAMTFTKYRITVRSCRHLVTLCRTTIVDIFGLFSHVPVNCDQDKRRRGLEMDWTFQCSESFKTRKQQCPKQRMRCEGLKRHQHDLSFVPSPTLLSCLGINNRLRLKSGKPVDSSIIW